MEQTHKDPNKEHAPQDVVARPKNPREEARYWQDELTASKRMLEQWRKQATKIVKRYVDDRGSTGTVGVERSGDMTRLNLFHSNIKTMMDMMYASLPKVEASRQHADSDDDVARVAAEIMERLINLDIQKQGQDYDSVLRSVLQDRLLPGLGCARVRYTFKKEKVEVPSVVPFAKPQLVDKITDEDVPVDYYHWQDVAWGWARNYSEIPWLAYRSYMSKDEIIERFGEGFVDHLEFTKQRSTDATDEDTGRNEDDSPWNKAAVWEIWDKEKREVVWWSQGAPKLLDKRPDPLQLADFYPSPPFLIANPTTTLYRPTPDYHLSQDLYNEVDRLQTRIMIITQAVKVVGVYDAQADDSVGRMFGEAVENDLIPVDSWAMFAESGGLKGSIDWLPVGEVVETLNTLTGIRDNTIQLLQQVNGMSDIMQGGLANQYEGVGQSQMKAQFGSVRVQALQDQFAKFASDLLQLKAEVICKHFQPESIAKLANVQFGYDQEHVGPAIQLLKQPDMAHIRIIVRPESVAMVDFARLKTERTEFLNGMATFMQSAAPLIEQNKQATPYLLKMLQWAMAGFKGSSEIEGVMDKAIEANIAQLKQEAQNPQPDPQQQAEQAKIQGELQKIKAKSQADMQMRQADLRADMQTAAAQHQAKMTEIIATHRGRMEQIEAKMLADLQTEQAGLEANIMQTNASADAEVMKDAVEADLEIEKAQAQAAIEISQKTEESVLEMEKMGVQSAAKISEMITGAELKPEPQEKGNDDS